MAWREIAEIVLVLQFVAATATAAGILLDRRMRASSAMSWLLFILAVPFVGIGFYLIVGRPWLSKRRRERQRRIREGIYERLEVPMSVKVSAVREALARMPEGTRSLAILAGGISGHAPVGGNEVEYFADTPELMERLAADIDEAKRHVHLCFYIALDDEGGLPVMEAMMRAARRGVEVRFLVDAIGSRAFLKGPTPARLREAGVRVVAALPAGLLRAFFERIDLRNHRKVVVIDDRIGYLGSHNLAAATFKVKRKYAPWVDTTCRVEGPAAQSLQRVFIEDWAAEVDEEDLARFLHPVRFEQGGVAVQVVATGPTTEEGAMPQLIVTCLALARREVVLTTPYFVPDEATMTALRAAAGRGVRVKLVVPEYNDSQLVKLASRSFFQRLLDGGIELMQFRGGMLHAKTIAIDDRIALISSANLDRRSFEINFEASLLLYDRDATLALNRVQQAYIERSRRIDKAEFEARPWWNRLIENACGLASPLL